MTDSHPTHYTVHPNALIHRLGLRPGMRAGDFGVGGQGFFVTAMASRVGPTGQVLMFDVKKTALKSALGIAQMNGLKNCQAVWSDLEVYEGARGIGRTSLDAGALINVLHQSTKHQDMLTEIHRMLKPGARLLIVDWQPGGKSPGAPPPDHRLAADHVIGLAKTIGYALLERFQASPSHWGVVMVKT